MKYISAEEFLKQPKQVQEVLRDWWQPEFGDLFLDDYSDCDSMINIVGCVPINKKHFEDHSGDIHYKTELTIPLLTEGQLRQFIEDKTNKEYSILNTIDGYKINFSFAKCKNVKYFLTTSYYNNLLQALWRGACQIAKEETNNQK